MCRKEVNNLFTRWQAHLRLRCDKLHCAYCMKRHDAKLAMSLYSVLNWTWCVKSSEELDAEYVAISGYFWEWVETKIPEKIKHGFPSGGRANRILKILVGRILNPAREF